MEKYYSLKNQNSFMKLQKIMTKDLLSYKSILTSKKISKIKPQIYGKFFIKINGDEKFKIASVQVHRMVITAKISKFKTNPCIESPNQKSYPSNEHFDPEEIRSKVKRNTVEKIQIFLPEWKAEYADFYDSNSNSSASFEEESLILEEEPESRKMIVLRNCGGTRIIITASSQKETKNLWLYIYGMCFQKSLPGFLKKTKISEVEDNFIYEFDNVSNFVNYSVSAIALSQTRKVKQILALWLFRMNIEKMRNLTFNKFTMLCVDDDNLVFCELNIGNSFIKAKEIYNMNEPENVELLIYKLREFTYLIQNMAIRNIFISEDFQFENILYKKGVFFLKSVSGLELIPEMNLSSKDSFKWLIKKLFMIQKNASREGKPLEIAKNLCLIQAICEMVKMEKLKSIEEIISYLRLNYTDLTMHQESKLTSKEKTSGLAINTLDRKLKIQKTKTNEVQFSGLYGMSESKLNFPPPTRKHYMKNKFLSNDSNEKYDAEKIGFAKESENFTWEDTDEHPDVQNINRRKERMRTLKFKNRFMG